MIRANDMGVASLLLLKRGHTLDMVRSELGQRYGFAAADVDIAPLLISLAHADFIKQIGDHVISTISQPFLARTWARIVSAVRTKVVVQAIKSMPLPIMFRLVYKKPRPDPKNANLTVVDLEFVTRLEPPTTLREIKESEHFNDWALVRQGRLSTMAAPAAFVTWISKRYPKIKI